MFADTATIIIRSGNGGNGHVSFRREKFVPNGGPDGGDGGKGGDLIFEVDKGATSLVEFRHKRKYAATNGEEGGKKRCHGCDGEDLVIKVPLGTVIKDAASGKVIKDMSGDNLRTVLLKGGRGGLGNMHFATSTMQTPRYAQPGQEGIELEVKLELKVIADAGLVGFPNTGKSSLITCSSNARPEIANYHFTTLSPHLGVVDLDDSSFIMADIPGLIEGASEGIGLGHDFLRHIQRCRVLIHVVDAAGVEGRDPVEDIVKINSELYKFDPELLKKPQIIAANKTDVMSEDDLNLVLDHLNDAVKSGKAGFLNTDVKIYPISAVTGKGVKDLIFAVSEILNNTEKDTIIYENEFDIEAHRYDNLAVNIYKDGKVYVADGERIEKMLGYTNLESEKGFAFFQNYMKEQKIIDEMKKLGLKDGDTVRICGLEFDYFD